MDFLKASTSSKPEISIVIPVYNGGEKFRKCLASLDRPSPEVEVIVVDDHGSDHSWQLAKHFGAEVIRLPFNSGPAHARNAGAQIATGEILFFVDADVAIHSDTIAQIIAEFRDRPRLAALIGSYDDAPGAPNFLSQYKNLLHHYTHQTASPEASTFWGACGAIRRQIFLDIGGFDTAYRQPSIEDIELGYRLKRSGYQIRLSKAIQVKHLKRWDALSLLKADFFYRALPWTKLIHRDGKLINDLNLQTSSRVSVVAVYGLLAALIMALFGSGWGLVALNVAGIYALALLILNAPVYQFLRHKRGLWFALQSLPWHWLYYAYSGLAFAIGTLQHHLIRLNGCSQTSAQIKSLEPVLSHLAPLSSAGKK
ncbi:MAG: glycosyltransferase [Leptolyngbyaceae cyanobacterium CSU_1_3]|nr:glycosyltransferase [Leptolyngbyaceae cyanobacterium CSU_1_3]